MPYVWGVAADEVGIIQHTRVTGEVIPGGGFRATKTTETHHEPASAYASVHVSPMPMKWNHHDTIGRVVALVRREGRLLAVGVTTELDPSDLEALAEKFGDLRWSTSTNNRANEKLKIDEISLTPRPATNGLPSVRWWKLGAQKGNLPTWVTEAVKHADKTEHRQRGQLLVQGAPQWPSPNNRSAQYYSGGETLEYSTHPGGRVLSVGRKSVKQR